MKTKSNNTWENNHTYNYDEALNPLWAMILPSMNVNCMLFGHIVITAMRNCIESAFISFYCLGAQTPKHV